MCYNIQYEYYSFQKLETKLDLLQICLKAATIFWYQKRRKISNEENSSNGFGFGESVRKHIQRSAVIELEGRWVFSD